MPRSNNLFNHAYPKPRGTLIGSLGIYIMGINSGRPDTCHAWQLLSYVYTVCASSNGCTVSIDNMPRLPKSYTEDEKAKLQCLLKAMYDRRESLLRCQDNLISCSKFDAFLSEYIKTVSDNVAHYDYKMLSGYDVVYDRRELALSYQDGSPSDNVNYYRLLSGHDDRSNAVLPIAMCAMALSPCEHMLLDLNIIKGLLESCGVDTVNLYQKSHKDLVRDRAFIMSGDLFKELNEHFGPSSEGIDHDDKLIKELVRRALMAPSDGDHITTTDVVKVIILYSAANEKLDMALPFKSDAAHGLDGLGERNRSEFYRLCLQCMIAKPDVGNGHQGELQTMKEHATKLHRALVDYDVENHFHKSSNAIIVCGLIKCYVSKMLANGTFDEATHKELKCYIGAVEDCKIMSAGQCLGTIKQVLMDKADHNPALEQAGDTPDSKLCEVGVEHKMAVTTYEEHCN